MPGAPRALPSTPQHPAGPRVGGVRGRGSGAPPPPPRAGRLAPLPRCFLPGPGPGLLPFADSAPIPGSGGGVVGAAGKERQIPPQRSPGTKLCARVSHALHGQEGNDRCRCAQALCTQSGSEPKRCASGVPVSPADLRWCTRGREQGRVPAAGASRLQDEGRSRHLPLLPLTRQGLGPSAPRAPSLVPP